jgi:hypothetical protein
MSVSSGSVTYLQYGIKVPHNNPRNARILRTLMCYIMPEVMSFSWGVMAIYECDFDGVRKASVGSFTG